MPSGVRRFALAILATIAVALVTTTVAYSGNGGFLPGEPHSPNADNIHEAFIIVAIFTGVILVGVEVALVLFVVKYRRGKRARTAEGPQIHGSTKLEIIWTVFPVIVLAIIGSFVFYLLPGIADAPKASAADQTRIGVIGKQFYWQFNYPNGAISVDHLVAPADEVVNEDITAPRWDVIHSWWIPDLGGKYDAIPGRVNKTWFKAPVGTYAAQCYELCGIQHADMSASVSVVPRAEYASFLAKRRSAAGILPLGREEWEGVCLKCHRLDHKYIGPALGGNPLLADPRALRVLLENGRGQMPPVGRGWTDRQFTALVAYAKRFAGGGGG
jgi:cytochrome c oxidase subunit 2